MYHPWGLPPAIPLGETNMAVFVIEFSPLNVCLFKVACKTKAFSQMFQI